MKIGDRLGMNVRKVLANLPILQAAIHGQPVERVRISGIRRDLRRSQPAGGAWPSGMDSLLKAHI